MLVQSPTRKPFRFLQVHKLLHVQQFATQSTKRTLGKTVLPRRTQLDIKQFQPGTIGMTANRLRNKLGTVVAANVLRHATRHKQFFQHGQHLLGDNPASHFQRQTFPRELVGNREPLLTAGPKPFRRR